MINIVINEAEKAKELLENIDKINENLYQNLLILSKYFKYVLNYQENKIKKELNLILEKTVKKYIPREYEDFIDKIIKKSNEQSLFCYENMPITNNEVKLIKELKDKTLERIMFTLVCLAKYFDLINSKNNHWVALDIKAIFYISGLKRTKVDQIKILRKLKELDYIEFSKNIVSNSIRVKAIEKLKNYKDKNENVIYIKEFKDLCKLYK